MISSDKEEKIIQRSLIVVGLNEIRAKLWFQDKKEEGDKVTLRIHKAILELRDLFFDERDIWNE